MINISKIKKLSVFLIISTITGFDAYLFGTLEITFGLPFPPYTYLYLFLIPGLFLIQLALQNGNLKLPNVLSYISFVTILYVLEVYYRDFFYEPDLDLIRRVSPMFFAYLAFVNFGLLKEDYYNVLKSVIYVLLSISTLFYLGFLGVLNTGNISTFDDGRTMSNWNLNVVSDMSVLGIYLSYILHRHGERVSINKININPILITFYFLIILLFSATRGSIVLFLFGCFFYYLSVYSEISVVKKTMFIIGSISILIIIIFSNFQNALSNNLFVFERLFNSEYESEGRFLQIVASWENFKENYLIGVGYSRAADNMFDGISRSNFQYTQILGAGGIILFITYFGFIFKMFLGKLNNSKNIVILSMFAFVLVSFIFRRIEMYYGILAYVVFQEARLVKKSKINEH